MSRVVEVLDLGRSRYLEVFEQMQAFTRDRGAATMDQIWLTEHDPVFTQGQAGRAEHLLMPGDIEVVQSDRGGQVTYHGPGQIVGYLLFDLKRMKLSVRDLVTGIEQAMIGVLLEHGIEAAARPDAPGVYSEDEKIGSLGLRVRRGCSYHGLALNVNMDLEPFSRINPCGLVGMSVTQMKDRAGTEDLDEVRAELLAALARVYDLDLRSGSAQVGQPGSLGSLSLRHSMRRASK